MDNSQKRRNNHLGFLHSRVRSISYARYAPFLVIELFRSSSTASCVKVVVTLQRAAFDCLSRTDSVLSSFHEHTPARWGQAAADASSRLNPHATPVVRTRCSSIVGAHTACPHRSSATVTTLHVPARYCERELSRHKRIEAGRSTSIRHGHSVVKEWHVVQAEVARCTRRHVVVDREVAVAASIVATLGKSGWVKDIAVDKLNLHHGQ